MKPVYVESEGYIKTEEIMANPSGVLLAKKVKDKQKELMSAYPNLSPCELFLRAVDLVIKADPTVLAAYRKEINPFL
jgi:hypothetical protein